MTKEICFDRSLSVLLLLRRTFQPMNFTTKTELVSQWTSTVTASPELQAAGGADSSPKVETLSEVDEWLTKSSHWLGFSLRFDDILDAQKVKEGLAKTLFHVPALGARVVRNNGVEDGKNLYQLAILGAPNQGVVLEYCKGRTLDDSSSCLPNESCSRRIWKEAGLEAPGPGYSGEASQTNPLMRAKLIVFEEQQVSYLCIGINHGICDGHGICDLLQIWSHFCSHSEEPLPEPLARRRVLGERVFEAAKPAKDMEELYSRLETEVGVPYDPFSFFTLLFRVVPRAIWCMSRQHELELRVNASKLAELKQQITKLHLQKGEWVSTFEILCASLFLARRVTSADSEISESHNLHVACNLRGRSKRFSKDYFGNAAYDFCEPMTNLPVASEWTTETLVEIVKQVHKTVRRGLSDAETNACKTKDWYEAARHLGLKNSYDIWAPMIFDAIRGEGTFINSWDKRWLDCSLGSEAKASSMVAWFGTLQNIVVEVPRHSQTGDSTIYLALPPSHAKRFHSFYQDNKEVLPFEIVS